MIPDVLQELALAEEILTVMIEKFPIIFEDMVTVREEHRKRGEALDEELDQIRQELENMGAPVTVIRERGNTIATTREFADISLSPPNLNSKKKEKSRSIFVDLEESISTLNDDNPPMTPTDPGIVPKTPPPTPRVNADLSISLSSDTGTTNSVAPSMTNSPHLSSGSMSSQLADSENADAGVTDTVFHNHTITNIQKDERNSLKVSTEVGKERSRQRLREIEDEILRLIDEIEDEQKSGKVEYMSLSSSYEEKAEIDSLPTTPRSVAEEPSKKDEEVQLAEAESKNTSELNLPEKIEENNTNAGERKETKEERAARREARRQKRKDKKDRKQKEAEERQQVSVSINGEAAKDSTGQSDLLSFVIPQVNITPADDTEHQGDSNNKATDVTEEQPTERKRSRSVRIQDEDGSVVELTNNSDKSGLQAIGEDEELESLIEVTNQGNTLVVNVKKRKSLVIVSPGSGAKRVSLKEYRVKKLVEEFSKLQEEQEARLEELRKHRAKSRFERVLEEINGMNPTDLTTASAPTTPRDNFSLHRQVSVPVIQSGPRPTSAKSYVPKGPHHFVPLLSTNDFKNGKGGPKNSPRLNTNAVSDVAHTTAKAEENLPDKPQQAEVAQFEAW